MNDLKKIDEEIEVHSNKTYITPYSVGSFFVNSRISSAVFDLSPLEIKSWLLLVASIELNNADAPETSYVFNALTFADRLNIDKRRPRGRDVANIFSRLNKKTIIAEGPVDENGEGKMFSSAFISYSYYDNTTYNIEIGIPKPMNNFMFNFRKSSSIFLEIEDVLALDTTTAMRVFVYLKDKTRQGINTVTVSQFRHDIQFLPQSPYKDFKRYVIKKSVDEIRRHTGYKDFFIEDDGARGKAATIITFGFEKPKELDDGLLSGLEGNLKEKLLKKFSKQVLIVMTLALDNGFNPAFIKNKFDNIADSQIVDNFHYVLDIINNDRRKHEEKEPDVYGKYFISAVVEDWAQKHKDSQKKWKAREQKFATEQEIKREQEIETIKAAFDVSYDSAKNYVDNMNSGELVKFINKNISFLNAIAKKPLFNLEKAVTRNKRYREYKILCKFVMGRMMSGEIEVADEIRLF